MTKLTGAALDRALANALWVKSVHDCENWGERMIIERAADPKAFYGFPSGSVSALNASGKCVTDGETSL